MSHFKDSKKEDVGLRAREEEKERENKRDKEKKGEREREREKGKEKLINESPNVYTEVEMQRKKNCEGFLSEIYSLISYVH